MCMDTRWDVNSIDTLPECMALCFLAIYNTVNGIAYDIFNERGINCLPYLTKSVCNTTFVFVLCIFGITKTKMFV